MDSTPERILEATRLVLAEAGFSSEVTAVAKRAGVGVGTIYRHFGSRDGLLRVVVGEVIDRARVELTAIAVGVEDAEEAIRGTMAAGFQMVDEYGQLAIELTAGTHPALFTEVTESRAEMARMFGSLIKRGIAQGHFPDTIDVRYAVCAWFGLVAPTMLRDLLAVRNVSDVAAMTTRFFLAGLRGLGEGT